MNLLYKSFVSTVLSSTALLVLTVSSAAIAPAVAAETNSGSTEPFTARFRGCQSAGWCRFEVDGPASTTQSLYRVYPDGVLRRADEVYSTAVRDRLNALLVDMIHQYKRIELLDLRGVGDGLFAAVVTVDGNDVASDPILLELRGKPAGNPR